MTLPTFTAHERLPASKLTTVTAATAVALAADGALPGMIVGTPSLVTADSSGVTADTEVQTLTVPVVSGRVYKVHWLAKLLSSSTATDTARANIKEDSSAGTQLQSGNVVVGATGSVGAVIHLVALYTADATENKTFSFTISRAAGAGNISLEAASDRPAIAWAEYLYTP